MIVAEKKLFGGAKHAAGFLTRDVHVLDQLAVGHGGARQGDRDERSRDRVGSAGDDLHHASTEVDLMDPQGVARRGVRFLLEHLADHDLGEVDHGQRLDLDAKASQHVGRVFRRDAIQVNEVAEPLVADPHVLRVPHPDSPDYPGNCSDKRSLRPDYPGIWRSPMQEHVQNCSRKRRSDS